MLPKQPSAAEQGIPTGQPICALGAAREASKHELTCVPSAQLQTRRKPKELSQVPL